jgi:hypothetical protein
MTAGYGMRDEGILRLQVEDVVLVDARRHHHQRTLRHLRGARRILDELDEIVLEHHGARRDREVAAHLEGRLVGLADATALDVAKQVRQPARQALTAGLERLLERLGVGGRKIRRAHGVHPLLHREAGALLGRRIERRLFHQVLEVARSKQIGLLQVIVVGIVAPFAVAEAPVAGFGRGERFAAAGHERMPELRLLLEVGRLQRGVGRQPGCICGRRRAGHQAHPALRQFVARLRDRRQDGLWRPRVHARAILRRTRRRVK